MPSERYCPLCNRRTRRVYEAVEPFVIESCQACGHVHAIVERPPVPARANDAS